MKHWVSRFRLGFALTGIVLTLAGCATGPYYKEAGVIGGGWREKEISPNYYGVYFAAVGGYPDDARYGCQYRASEIGFKKGYRYFRIVKTEDNSQNQHVHGGGYGGTTNFDVENGVMWLYVKFTNDLPCKSKKINYSYYICNGVKYFDCYSILDEKYVPGTKTVYTRAERRTDAQKGIHFWEEKQEQQPDK